MVNTWVAYVPPDEGAGRCLGMKKPRASKSRFDDCEAKASVVCAWSR